MSHKDDLKNKNVKLDWKEDEYSRGGDGDESDKKRFFLLSRICSFFKEKIERIKRYIKFKIG